MTIRRKVILLYASPLRLDRSVHRSVEPALNLIVPRERAAHTPLPQDAGKLLRDEESCTFRIIGILQEFVIIREDVTSIGNERQPCCCLRRSNA